MADPKTLIEGSLKYRDGRKWKPRWCVVSKLSPVADCLHLQLYRDSKDRCKNGPTKASLSLEGFLGMETGFTLDKESNTMALVCSEVVIMLAFDSREVLIQWQVKVRANLAEEQQFLVQIVHVPAKSKLTSGPARLHLQDHAFCLVSGIPPRLLGAWPLQELRRFGVVDGKFCFEGGSKCGKGEGLHVLHTNQAAELSKAFELASKGKLESKRKMLSRKSSVLEGSSRMSLQPKKTHKSFEHGSNESSRPLLSSGSDGSTCDVCSEIIRLTPDDLSLDDSFSCKSVCKVHLKWPSTSHCGPPSSSRSSLRDSAHHICGTNLFSGNGDGPNHRLSVDVQSLGSSDPCSKCGCHYSGKGSLPFRGRHCSLSAETTGGAFDFSSHWTMFGLRESSLSSRNSAPHHRMKPPADRDSLCSESSQSSGTSSASSSSSSSETSIRRNYLESFYDRPRRVHSVCRRDGSVHAKGLPGRTAICYSCDQVPEGREIEGMHEEALVCTCQDSGKELSSECEDNLPGVHGAFCHRATSLRKGSMAVSATSSRSGSSSESPPPSPKKGPSFQFQSATLPVIRGRDGTPALVQLPCICGQEPNPYGHYAVPRTALANMYLREKQALNAANTNSKEKDAERSTNVGPTEAYDVPRKFKEIISSDTLPATATSTGCVCAQESSQNTDGIVDNRPPLLTQQNVCPCQRVMLWAGSLVPCWGKQPPDEYSSESCKRGYFQCDSNSFWVKISSLQKNSACTETVKPLKMMDNRSGNGQLHAVCTCHFTSDKDDAQEQTRQNASNPTDSQNITEQPQSQGTINCTGVKNSKQNVVEMSKNNPFLEPTTAQNYGNLEFVQSLSLYENANCVVTRLKCTQDEASSAEDTSNQCYESPSSVSLMSVSSSSQCSPSPQGAEAKSNENENATQKNPPRNHSLSPYEMMSFSNDKLTPDDGNYMLMQPLCSKSAVITSQPTLPQVNVREQVCETQSNSSPSKISSTKDISFPLRPFMPFLLPFQSKEKKSSTDQDKEADGDKHSNEANSQVDQQIGNPSSQNQSPRSCLLSSAAKKALFHHRSNSEDGKQESTATKDSSKQDRGVPSPSGGSVQGTPTRKGSLFTMFSLNSKTKSFSTDDFTPPSSASSSPSMSLEFLHHAAFHRSADCLKLKEDYRSSEEDLCRSAKSRPPSTSQKTASASHSIKRSSSVPCEPFLTEDSTTNSTVSPQHIVQDDGLDADEYALVVPTVHSYQQCSCFMDSSHSENDGKTLIRPYLHCHEVAYRSAEDSPTQFRKAEMRCMDHSMASDSLSAVHRVTPTSLSSKGMDPCNVSSRCPSASKPSIQGATHCTIIHCVNPAASSQAANEYCNVIRGGVVPKSGVIAGGGWGLQPRGEVTEHSDAKQDLGNSRDCLQSSENTFH